MTTPTQAQWTPELIQEAISMYIERMEAIDEDKRAEQTVEVTSEIAEELGFKLNSVRAQLSKAKRPDGSDVYIRKAKAKNTTAAAGGGTATKRVSKADAQAELVQALGSVGATVSDELQELITKMTGKAAQALADALTQIEE